MVLLDGVEPSTSPYHGDVLPLQTMGACLVPLVRFERTELLLLREPTLPICPQGRGSSYWI